MRFCALGNQQLQYQTGSNPFDFSFDKDFRVTLRVKVNATEGLGMILSQALDPSTVTGYGAFTMYEGPSAQVITIRLQTTIGAVFRTIPYTLGVEQLIVVECIGNTMSTSIDGGIPVTDTITATRRKTTGQRLFLGSLPASSTIWDFNGTVADLKVEQL